MSNTCTMDTSLKVDESIWAKDYPKRCVVRVAPPCEHPDGQHLRWIMLAREEKGTILQQIDDTWLETPVAQVLCDYVSLSLRRRGVGPLQNRRLSLGFNTQWETLTCRGFFSLKLTTHSHRTPSAFVFRPPSWLVAAPCRLYMHLFQLCSQNKSLNRLIGLIPLHWSTNDPRVINPIPLPNPALRLAQPHPQIHFGSSRSLNAKPVSKWNLLLSYGQHFSRSLSEVCLSIWSLRHGDNKEGNRARAQRMYC